MSIDSKIFSQRFLSVLPEHQVANKHKEKKILTDNFCLPISETGKYIDYYV